MNKSSHNTPNVLLVRHAQSQANENYRVLHNITNMKVNITTTGEKQSQETGHFLTKYIQDKMSKPALDDVLIQEVIIWNSPYNRTRQTASIIKDTVAKSTPVICKESVYLVERNFGLVDALDTYKDNYKNELDYYVRHTKAGDTFFCKPPLGESPFDLAMRMHQFYIQEVLTRPSAIHIIVSHGASLRALNLMVKNMPYESFLSSNPNNASVSQMHAFGLVELFCPSDVTS